MTKTHYIVTAIDYVNGEPHLGHAMERVEADALARYHRQQGDDVRLQIGTDEHGTKNMQSAEKLGMTPQAYVDMAAQKFEDLARAYNISYDYFIRTTNQQAHWPSVIKLWEQLVANGDLYKDTYEALYCVGCEEFKTDKDLVDGKCPDHNTAPELLSEENYFFNLGKYSDQIIQKIESNEFHIIPESKKNEILNILKGGYDRVSFSRPKEKLSWGVPVPNDPDHVMYVWCDALTNYISGLDYAHDGELFHKYWNDGEVTQIIGKGILKFHAAIWPAMLLAAGIKLPKRLFVHGYITIEGGKMSKSLGNVIDPMALVEEFGVDSVRYYLLKEIPSYGDGDFSRDRFKELYTADLANGIGNLFSRVTNMVEQYLSGKVKTDVVSGWTWNAFHNNMHALQFDKALEDIASCVSGFNRMIDDAKPWVLAKSDTQEDIDALEHVLSILIKGLQEIGQQLTPFMPTTGQTITEHLSRDTITKAAPLFARLEK